MHLILVFLILFYTLPYCIFMNSIYAILLNYNKYVKRKSKTFYKMLTLLYFNKYI